MRNVQHMINTYAYCNAANHNVSIQQLSVLQDKLASLAGRPSSPETFQPTHC
jgi:hypothetical protein